MAKQYIEPQKRYEDHKSTGILFLAIGAVGAVVTILCWIDILTFPLNGLQLGIMLAMFVAFIGFGFWSMKRASEVFKTIDTENDHVAEMRKWIEDNRDSFCVSDITDLADNELYFQREQDIHDAISNQFPDLEESLLDIFVEETYQALFEEM
jgi:hypothetical protein